nr:helix-turn-helix domain-containing protein [Leptospira perolatii]
MASLLQETVFFGAVFCLLLGTAALIRPNRRISNKLMFLLSVAVSVLFFYVYFLLRDIYFEPPFFNHLHIPFAWLLGPGMYSLFSATVKDQYEFKSDRWFYFPGALLFFALPLGSLVAPQYFRLRPVDYFVEGSTTPLDLLLLCAFLCNLGYYLKVFWDTRAMYRFENLKEEPGARVLLFIILGSSSVTLVLVFSYLLRDLHLLFGATVGTTFYAVASYLAHQHTPRLLQEIGPAVRDAYRNTRLEGIDLDALDYQVNELMFTEKLFLEEELTLSAMADKLDIKPYQLSEFLNQHRKTNFSRFINNFRVDEAVSILEKENGASILSVAYRSGFNSKATFNLAFKSAKGVSPREYLRRVKSI